MVSIKVSEIQRKAAEEKLKPKALPKITVKKNSEDWDPNPPLNISHDQGAINYSVTTIKAPGPRKEVEPVIVITTPETKPDLVKSLWNEFHAVSIEQKKLSTEIAKLVNAGASQERLKQQYESIESYQPKLQAIREKIHYAETHGILHSPPEQEKIDDDINALKVKSTSLVQKRSKLKAKLKVKVAKNPERFVFWEQELAAAEIEYEDVERRINLLQTK